MKLAIAQIDTSVDIRQNGRVMRRAMMRAARRGARLIHFSEGALSGYVKAVNTRRLESSRTDET